jgi:hypothetical protein
VAFRRDYESPPFTADDCARLLGKRLLVGITRVHYDGAVIGQEQFCGVIEVVSDELGILLRLADGRTRTLPPEIEAIEDAEPGVYHLRTTGEEIHDPDYVSTWTVRVPDA